MRSRFIHAAALATLLAGSVGTTPAYAHDATSTRPPATTGRISAERLKSALITLSDLPAGYLPLTSQPGELVWLTFISGDPGCAELVDIQNRINAEVDPVGTKVSAYYRQGIAGPLVAEGLINLAPRDSTSFLNDMERSVSQCESYVVDMGTGVPAEVHRVYSGRPQIGDAAFRVRFIITMGAVTVQSDHLAARVGNVLVSLGFSALGTSDPSIMDGLATTAAAKARELQPCRHHGR